ncbi:hypothetical protein CHUAL_005122 [Chamberlinius hualienensis]
MFFILSLVLLMDKFYFSLTIPTPCNKLPQESIDLEVILRNNPKFMYRSTWSALRCVKMVHVPPLPKDNSYTLTAMINQGSASFSARAVLTEGKIWNSTMCTDGNSASYTNALVIFNDTNSAWITVSCGADGINYNIVAALGRSESDEEIVDKFLKNHEIPGVLNTYDGCNFGTDFCPTKTGLASKLN